MRFIILFFVIFTFLLPAEQHLKDRIKIKKHTEYEEGDSTEDYSIEKIELLAKKRHLLMQDIKRFIRESKADDQKAELNLRLAGLYMEDYQQGLAKSQSLFAQEMARWEKRKRKNTQLPKMDESEALASLEKARGIYKELLVRHPSHPRKDEMLFFLGQTSLDRGKTNEGMKYFERLSNETPNSKYTNDALVQLGDYYFEKNQYAEAEGFYDKILQRKYRPLVPYAAYKKGWCEYNQQRLAQALSHFKWVVNYEDTREGTKHSLRLKNEVMRDIALVFVGLRIVDEAIEFFKNHKDPYYRQGLETMAQLYFEAGEYKNAIHLYGLLLAYDPNHPKDPSFEINIVESLKLSGQGPQAVERLFNRLPLYVENSNWYEINAANTPVIKEANQGFEELARKYAIQYHSEAQKTKNDALYEIAKTLHTKYIEVFPESEHTPTLRFYLAEILYRQEQFIPAAHHYYAVFKHPLANNLKSDSIRYALMALGREINNERKKQGLSEINTQNTTKLQSDEATPETVAYSEVESRFLQISDEYLSTYPATKEAPDILYEQSYLYYSHHDLKPAYKGFWIAVQKYTSHPTAKPSAHLILDILNRRQDYSKLVLACQKFLQTSAFSDPSFKRDVSDILRRAELKRISLLEEKGEYKTAANKYIEYTKAYGPEDETLFEKALYNAGVNFLKAEAYLQAVETQERFLRRFPKSTLKESILLQVAKTYETLANFEKSALYFESFADQYPHHEQSKNALRLAGLYYWGSGNPTKAEAIMLRHMQTYPSEAKKIEGDLVDLYESSRAYEKLATFYNRRRFERGTSYSDHVDYSLKLAELYAEKNGKIPLKIIDETFTVAQRQYKDLAASPKGVEGLSKLFFYQATRKEEAFYKIKLSLPQERLEANLARKLALIKELEKDYGRILSLGSGEWGLAAFYKTAAAYRHLALAVLQAPVPGELQGEQVDKYREEIHRQMVKPFNEKALVFATQCLDKSQEFNILSSWTPKCYQILTEIDPARYPIARTFYLPSLEVALLDVENSKTPTGSTRNFVYPFFSTGLFKNDSGTTLDLPSIYDRQGTQADQNLAIPSRITYTALADERRSILKKILESEKSEGRVSLAWLNVARIADPKRALLPLLDTLSRDPSNPALHNLLGLTYLELGNYPAAKVTWLAMIVRGIQHSAVWNNLGVLSQLEGNETAALRYFEEALKRGSALEAHNNVGFIALKYRNGFEAKRQFSKANLHKRSGITSQIGLAVGMLQNREIEESKSLLMELGSKQKRDPYIRVSVSYFLVDIEREADSANRYLTDYVDSQSLESDPFYRQALQDMKSAMGGGIESLSAIQP